MPAAVRAVILGTGGARADYEFRYGGVSSSIEHGVRVFSLGTSSALLSMNAQHIAAIVCHDGQSFELDPDRPFVLLLPTGGFDAYDSAGQLIELDADGWHEQTSLG